jgi:hypothetical protein
MLSRVHVIVRLTLTGGPVPFGASMLDGDGDRGKN